MSEQKENIEVAESAATEQPAGAEGKGKKPVKQPKEGDTEGQPLSRQKQQESGRAALRLHGLGEVWVTSDGVVFAQEGDARNHARSLKVKEVINVKA